MACSEQEVHYNDIGTAFIVTIKDCVSGTATVMDISTASTAELIFKSPSGVTKTKTASFVTDGTDGKIQYGTIDGDLNEIGTWRLQSKIVLPGGTWRTDVGTFRVYENL
jgi:hypothetical protein